MLPWLRNRVRALYRWVRDQYVWVSVTAVPWAVLLFGAVLLVVPEQTKDMLIQARQWPFALGFACAAFAWSFSLWYWARWGVTLAWGRGQRGGQPFLATAMPRVVAVLASLAALWGAYRATALHGVAVPLAAVSAALIWFLAYWRTRVPRPGWLNADAAYVAPAVIPAQWLPRLMLGDLAAAPFGRRISGALLALCTLLLLGFAAVPVTLATPLGATSAVLFALAFLSAAATFLARGLAANTGLPWLAFGVIGALLGGSWTQTDHRLRVLDPRDGPAPGAPWPSMQAAAADWLKACAADIRGADGRAKVVLVGSAGGASRAALWTLRALDAFSAPDPAAPGAPLDRHFPQRVFAVSSVSGGSLGAALWVGLLARDGVGCGKPGSGDPASRHEAGFRIGRRDFIAPTMATLVARDLPYAALVPLNLALNWAGWAPRDRSAVLEEAWEAAWRREGGAAPDLFAGALDALWSGETRRPLLLLNGTMDQTGLPVLTAPLAEVCPEEFPATYDGGRLAGGALAVSTAVLNSARFPVITTQGRVTLRPEMTHCGGDKTAATGQRSGIPRAVPRQIADGGYFDNIGAGTLVNASLALQVAFRAVRGDMQPPASGLDIMVVEINSDPTKLVFEPHPQGAAARVRYDGTMRCDHKDLPPPSPEAGQGTTMNEEIAPLLTVAATQQGQTFHRFVQMNRTFCPPMERPPADPDTPRFDYFVLSLCTHPARSTPEVPPLPLNWVMPDETVRYLQGSAGPDSDAIQDCGNTQQLGRYKAALAEWGSDAR